MIKNSPLWIVTDVDGTLMDHSYDLGPAKETIKFLKKNSIPVILCTSKTSSEVKVIREELELTDPYIVENGGAIYGNKLNGDNFEIILGDSYKKLEEILNLFSKKVNYPLEPLNNLSDEEATELTGLSGNSLILMRDRHWSMPFLNPPNYLEKELRLLCSDFNVDIFRGNRMSHLLSKNSNKGIAIKKLVDFYQNEDVSIIGLGDSPNDLPLLIHSQYKIVICGQNGPNQILLDKLKGYKYIISDEPNGYGWSKEILKLLNNINFVS